MKADKGSLVPTSLSTVIEASEETGGITSVFCAVGCDPKHVVQTGPATRWNEDGLITAYCFFADDKKHGIGMNFSNKGMLIQKQIWFEGEPVHVVEYDKLGRPTTYAGLLDDPRHKKLFKRTMYKEIVRLLPPKRK